MIGGPASPVESCSATSTPSAIACSAIEMETVPNGRLFFFVPANV